MEPIVDPKLPIRISPNPNTTGIMHPSVFASEFGCGGVMSSFESMSKTLEPAHWGLHGGTGPDNCTKGFNKQCYGGNVMAQRNYPCDNIISAYFPTERGYFDKVGKWEFQRQLYQCMIGAALQMKSTIEERRSRNELGHLVWQLNEIWPTGGWGSLEYGNPNMEGQVLGGRWKPLHYFYRSSTFKDVLATCNANGLGYIRNDNPFTRVYGSVIINVINIETGNHQRYRQKIDIAPGPGSIQTFDCPVVNNVGNHFLSIDVINNRKGDILSRNSPIFLTPPKELTASIPCDSGLEVSIQQQQLLDGNENHNATSSRIWINVTAKVPVALLVILTTQAHGRFSDNVFSIIGGSKIIEFHPFISDDDDDDEFDLQLLTSTLRVEDMAMYHHPNCKEITTSAASSIT